MLFHLSLDHGSLSSAFSIGSNIAPFCGFLAGTAVKQVSRMFSPPSSHSLFCPIHLGIQLYRIRLNGKTFVVIRFFKAHIRDSPSMKVTDCRKLERERIPSKLVLSQDFMVSHLNSYWFGWNPNRLVDGTPFVYILLTCGGHMTMLGLSMWLMCFLL